METATGVLVIVPCGRAKIWDKHPSHGAAPAKEAYSGAPFVLNRSYAERFGDAWVILSAKYGFVPPATPIPGPYEVTFKRPATGPVAVGRLREQITELGLERFPIVVGLGGKEYRAAIEEAFAGLPLCWLANRAIDAGNEAIDPVRRSRLPAIGEQRWLTITRRSVGPLGVRSWVSLGTLGFLTHLGFTGFGGLVERIWIISGRQVGVLGSG